MQNTKMLLVQNRKKFDFTKLPINNNKGVALYKLNCTTVNAWIEVHPFFKHVLGLSMKYMHEIIFNVYLGKVYRLIFMFDQTSRLK